MTRSGRIMTPGLWAGVVFVALLFAASAGLFVLGAALNASPAHAEPSPSGTMVVVKNIAGDRSVGYRCVIASTGGVDCDWTTPVRVPRS